MRSTRVLLLSTAVVPALMLVPGAAQARLHSRAHRLASRPCRIHLETPSSPIATGETTTILGHLICPEAEQEAAKQVVVYEHSASKPGGFAALPAVSTEAGGAFQVTPPALETDSTFYATSEGAISEHRTIRVAALVTPGAPTPPDGAQLLTKRGRSVNTVTFAGTVNAADAGGKIVLQRENATADEEWRAIQFGTVEAGGAYTIRHNFVLPGDANIRIVVRPPHGVNAPAASTPSSYEISQAENPALTLASLDNPISYGGSVTLKGVVAGAAPGTRVTLLAHGKKAAFAPVASTVTGSGGTYEFTQTPAASTYYRASSGSTVSAVVFEGVKYVLAQGPTTGTPQVGQPLTFSGTVLPALSGHPVYLERQGSLRLGWHVIDVGTVGVPAHAGEAAPYSIVHSFEAKGPARLRIAIPGDPVDQGAVGAPFELTIAPSPASLLRPVPPARLPSEGQL